MIVEGYSLLVATRSVLQGAQAMGMTFWEYLRRGMDPTTVAVMMEDGAAVAGLLIAGALPNCPYRPSNPPLQQLHLLNLNQIPLVEELGSSLWWPLSVSEALQCEHDKSAGSPQFCSAQRAHGMLTRACPVWAKALLL